MCWISGDSLNKEDDNLEEEEEVTEKEEEAAIKIQSHYKGYKTRKEYKSKEKNPNNTMKEDQDEVIFLLLIILFIEY